MLPRLQGMNVCPPDHQIVIERPVEKFHKVVVGAPETGTKFTAIPLFESLAFIVVRALAKPVRAFLLGEGGERGEDEHRPVPRWIPRRTLARCRSNSCCTMCRRKTTAHWSIWTRRLTSSLPTGRAGVQPLIRQTLPPLYYLCHKPVPDRSDTDDTQRAAYRAAYGTPTKGAESSNPYVVAFMTAEKKLLRCAAAAAAAARCAANAGGPCVLSSLIKSTRTEDIAGQQGEWAEAVRAEMAEMVVRVTLDPGGAAPPHSGGELQHNTMLMSELGVAGAVGDGGAGVGVDLS